ncbi:MAG: hypothetical protein J1F18_04785 [Lachnospiraceae bacterium]|nr:hypothetical protein [Lachnospiraceae bacterium]
MKMSATEIILIVIGVVIFLLGYLMPARKKDIDEEVQLISEDEIRKLVASETEHVKDRVEDIIDETVTYSIEKTERAMERVTNEKIMAINEYSDTVLEEINKNHKEVVFLYDMLNDKHDNLLATINEATAATDEIKQTVRDAELTATEAADKIDAVLQAADDAADMIKDAEDAAVEAQDAIRSVMRTVENTKGGLVSLHSALPYHEDVVEEVQRLVRDEAGPEDLQQKDAPILADASEIIGEEFATDDAEGLWEETQEEAIDAEMDTVADFTPISPRRVEIIHQSDGDFVAEPEEDMSTSEAFASMGFFAPRADEAEESGRRTRTRRSTRRERAQENAASMDIQFAQGKDNGRNSNERILELHKAGKSNMAIAKELGLGLGEVKLVIDLFEGM